jgi:branched-chain amino acid aminotransferase
MAEWGDWVWLNGRMVRSAEATVSVFDRSFLMGDGLFETMQSSDGRVFRLTRHLDRLKRGAIQLGLPLAWSMEGLTAAIGETLAANGLRDAAIRLTVSRGIGPPGPSPRGCGSATVVIAARPFESYPERWYQPGATAVMSRITKNERSPLCGLKATSYLEHVQARAEALERHADEALLRNTRGRLVEGSATNLFVVIEQILYTPDPGSGCLPGITREAVIELGRAQGMTVREAPILDTSVGGWDEAFLTNSLLGIAPLVRVEDRPVRSGRPGPVTGTLAREYDSLFADETGT